MSDIELYWKKIAESCGDNRTYFQLSNQERDMVVYSINLLLKVIRPTKTPHYTKD